MEKKMDLRIRKTYMAITNALEDLLLEKPLDEITVSEICEKAMVRRATFYKHFGDKNELLMFIINEMEEDIKKRQSDAHKLVSEVKIDFYQDILIMLNYLEEKEQLFCALSDNWSIGKLSNLISDNLTQGIKEYLTQNDNMSDPNSSASLLTCQLLTGSLIQGISWWMNHRELFTKEEMAEQLSIFCTDVLDNKK